MKHTLLSLFTCLLCLLLCAGTVSVGAESPDDAAAQAQEIADGIFAFSQQDAASTQEWIDTDLSAQAGTGAEWFILCLAQSGNYDFSAYEQALLAYLDTNTIPSATTKQKYALVLASIGSTDAYISEIADTTVGSLGIMSYAYGLHLANNGYATPLSADEIVNEILALQKQDGGWAVSGTVSDVDVTAMVLQALAPHSHKNAQAAAAVESALALLSSRQQEDGGFVSYGVANPESASQVIIALCALGIDPITDTRFIKSGNTAFDAIAAFALPDGSYCHQSGGAYSTSATAQVLCAATAYLRFADGKAPLYDLDHARPDEVQSAETESESESATLPAPEKQEEDDGESLSYKPVACLVIVALDGAVCILLVILKKRHYKNFLAVGIATAVLLAAVMLIDIRLPEDYYHGQSESKQNPIGTVTLQIRCDSVPGLDEIEYLPDDGIILAAETYEIEAGDTVYDILTEAARKHGLHVDASGAGDAAYVRGIEYLYEQQHGELSGWTYTVNGTSPSVGCGAYTLSDGDVIVWEYTLTVGQ
ncbi:MAG: DUF4430 domain-containing protein [Clostridia bacterium]|nr:DUF4430 domain-containing protein [Clostridia bacterium]